MSQPVPPLSPADSEYVLCCRRCGQEMPQPTAVEYMQTCCTACQAEIARLRAGIETLRLTEHYSEPEGLWDCPALSCAGPCNCNVAAHNARIDTLLRGAP